MASNSKKRRRVLRVSCILAALIIAGSSFAWFTSKDEVTNRLTASSDYGVSIVESFTPPANWMPGQEINKDVYAVNTGSIDSFVKETVKGVLDYTYESKVVDWSDKCVTLEDTAKTAIDGATTEEAGGFLAWTSVVEGTEGYIPPGTVVSARQTEDPAVSGRWTPTAQGVYIFRRAIAATKDGTGKTTGYTYEYAGYYYVPSGVADDPNTPEDESAGKYYKIVIGNDSFRAASENTTTTPVSFVYDISASSSQLGGTAVVGEDGVITGAPDIHYVLLNKVDNADVNFGYVKAGSADDDGNYGADYLAVRFDNTSGDMEAATTALAAAQTALDTARDNLANATTAALGAKSKALTDAEVDYRNAIGADNSAKSRRDQTQADYDYAKALQTAASNLKTAADARQTAETDRDTKYADLETKRDAVKTQANSDKAAFTNEMNTNTTNYAFDVLIPTAVQNLINGNGPDGQSNLSGAKQNMEAMRALWSQIKSLETEIKKDYDALNGIKTDRDLLDTTTSDQIETMMAKLEADMTALQTAITSYKATYQSLSNTLAEASLTGLVDGSATNGMAVNTTTTDLRSKVNAYKTSYDEYYAYLNNAGDENYTAKVQAWTDAVTAYNNAVSTAKAAYEVKVNTVQAEPNAFAYLQGTELGSRTLKNYNTTLVNTYTQLGGTAVGETASTDYTKYAGKTVATIDAEDDFLQIEGDTTTYPNTTEAQQTLGSLKTAATGTAAALTTATDTYNNAKTDLESESDYAAFNAAQTAYKAAQTTFADAQSAVNAAATGSSIEIDVVLDKGVNAATNPTWTVDERTANTTAVDFYLNQVLNAGDTSPKLIDKVVMRKTVDSRDYKDLTFDLNVALKSAQITYADDQRTYTTDAVVAPDFNMTPTVTANENVTWAVPTTP